MKKQCPEKLSRTTGCRLGDVSTTFLNSGNKQPIEKSRSVPNYFLATGRYLGEGFDLPALDTLFLTFPISWKGTLAQYAGRLHREHHGKTEVRIFDYVDVRISVLQRMHEKRLKGYYSLGYQCETNNDFAKSALPA